MKKYVIKNCPVTFQNIDNEYVCPSVCRQEGFPIYCENTTNCLLKRIVELCEPYLNLENFESSYFLAEDIVELLEIEEVE